MLKKVPCSNLELTLLYTLTGGQCFRWHQTGEGQWTGVFAHLIWTLSQDDKYLYYQVSGNSDETTEDNRNGKLKQKGLRKTGSIKEKSTKLKNENVRALPRYSRSRGIIATTVHSPDSKNKANKRYLNDDINNVDDGDAIHVELLRKYFRLDDISLTELYPKWSDMDPNFKKASVKFQGVRILAQDLVENLFSFICSANNNIVRISSMVEKLCILYGKKIANINGTSYYDFPDVCVLTNSSVEATLSREGFGYRAKYIHQAACKIEELGGSSWLNKLQKLPYAEAKTELIRLPGIGAKVADCICLMSLGHLEVIPVDTHIFQVAAQQYLPHLKTCKSVTNRISNEIGDYFRSLYGPYAGWAHTILFCADLKMFKDVPSERKPRTMLKKQKV